MHEAKGQPRLIHVTDPARAAEERAVVDWLKRRLVELGEEAGSLQVGFVATDMDTMVATQDPDRPRAGSLDIFQVPSIVEAMPHEDVPVARFVDDLKFGGHFFLLARASVDPPMLQEEILYVRADAPRLRPYSLVGPAREADW